MKVNVNLLCCMEMQNTGHTDHCMNIYGMHLQVKKKQQNLLQTNRANKIQHQGYQNTCYTFF